MESSSKNNKNNVVDKKVKTPETTIESQRINAKE